MRKILILMRVLVLALLPATAQATNFTMTTPNGIPLPSAYPEAGGIAMVMIGANGNVYYQFSNPAGAFRGFNSNGQPTQFRGNPFTINNPLTLDCGNTSCATYFGGSIAQMYIRFSAWDGDTQVGGFDQNDIDLVMNGFTVDNWSNITTEITNTAGTTSGGFVTGFGNNTFNTGWFSTTNAALLSNILSTGQTTTQVFDRDPDDNYWDFRRGSNLSNTGLVTVAPGYDMTKTADRTTFNAVGDVITYTYVVRNIGSVRIDNVAISDNKIASVTCDKTTIMDTPLGSTPDQAVCTGTYTVTQADVDAGSVTNIAQATGTPEYGTLGAVSDTVTVTGPAASPGLSLTKSTSVARFGNAGSTVPYNFTLRNTGNVTLTNVTVTDPKIPSLSCTYPSLAPGQQRVCSGSYTVTQADVDGWILSSATLSNTATVTGTTPSSATVSQSAGIAIAGPNAAPAVTVTKSAAPASYSAVGTVINYTIRVTNTGNVTFPAAPAISDPLITGAGGSITCPGGALAPGAFVDCTGSYAVTQADVTAGSVTNTATATITVAGQTASASGSATATATQVASMSLAKQLAAGSPTSFAATGVGLTYDYVLTNTGNVPLTAPAVSDNRVAVTCPAGTIAPGASVTCTSASYATTQADLDAGGVTNTATATALDPGSNTVTSAAAQLTVPAVQSPAMTMAKTAPTVAPASFAPGLVVPYSYTVTNTGNVTLAAPITVTDDRIGAPFACGTPPIAPGASVTCSASYTVTAADVAAGVVVNNAFATDGTTTSNTDTATIPQAGTPALTLAKTSTTPSFAALGDTIDYTFTVTNSGQTVIVFPGQPITINDAKVTGITCAQPATLSPGQSFACTGSYAAITQAELDAGQVVNTATASFVFNGPGGSTTITSPSSTAIVPTSATPSMTLAKSASPTQFSAVGDPITFTFTVTNTGVQTLASAAVTDPLIPGLSCTLTNIAPGGTASCSGTYNVTQADFDNAGLTNSASASAQTAGGATTSAGASTSVTRAPGAAMPAMSLTKTPSPASFTAVGDTLDYTLAVTNTGNVTLTGITVTDPLVPSFSCTIATLAPGTTDSSCLASYVVTQADVDAGQVVNTATATAPGAPPATVTQTTSGPARTPGLSMTKSGPAAFAAVGDSLDFTFAVTNTGNVTLTGVTVTDPLVPGFSCTIATLAPGATDSGCVATYVVTQADVDAGQIANTGAVSGSSPDESTPGTTASTTVSGPAEAPGLSVTKTETDGSGGFGAVGATESYDFAVSNTGNVTLTGLTLSDPLTGFSCALADLAPGASTTQCASSAPLSASVTITQAMFDAGTLSNTVTVSGQTVQATPVSASDTLVLPGPARNLAVTMTKTARAPLPPFDSPGQVINYDYVVTNSGNVTITAPVTVSDNRIASVSCPATPVAGIAPGGSLTCTASYTITQADIDAGGVTNNATATITQTLAGQPGPTTATAAASETVNATQLPGMTLAKTILAGTPSGYSAVGDTLTYQFRVTNSGNTTITGPVQVNDPLLGAPFACVAGPLAPAASATCTASYTVTQADLDAGSVANSATAFTGPQASPTLQSPPATANAFAVQSPGLSVAKSTAQTAPSEFFAGNVITYSYVVSNTGNVTIPAPIAINDNLIPSVTCPGGGLAPGASITCTGSYTITVNDIALGSVSNNASAVASFGGNPVPSTPGSATIPAGAAPALSITKSVLSGGTVTAAGDVVTYGFTVTNSGNAPFASDVVVFDDKIGGSITCFDSLGGTVSFNVGDVANCSGAYTVTQADMDNGTVTNNAYAQSIFAPASPTPTTVQSPTATVNLAVNAAPALSAVKSVTAGPNPAAVGDVLTYTITTTNSGNQTVSVITVSDPLIPALTCTIGGNPAPANIILAPAEVLVCTGSYTVTQADLDAQSLGNTATVDGVDPGGTPLSTTAGTTHPLAPAAPSLQVVKTVLAPSISPAYSGAGEQITYGVTVTNNGNVTVDSVSVTDPLVPTTTCTIGTLAPGQSDSSCQFVYTTTQLDVDAGAITNTATASGLPVNPGASPITGTGGITTPGPVAQPAFTVAKTADRTALNAAGEVVTYTYVVTNSSNVTIRGVPSVTDDKIGTFACGTAPLAPGDQTSCTATYTVLLSDMNAGALTNIATASAPAVPAGGGFPASPAVPASPQASVTLPVNVAPALTMTKSVLAEVQLFPTIWQATFALDLSNTGNVTLNNLNVLDDLTAFVAPATLLSASYPVATRVSGFATATADPGYDGVANLSLLAGGASMAPGETGRIEIDVTYSTAGGFPAGTNTATALSPTLPAPVPATAAITTIDSDGDGIPDSAESCATDRDGDGICDAQDYDPTGYFYCEDTGLILSGGSITVTGPAGSQTGIGTSNNITIVRDGSTGSYQFFVSAPGTYTLTPTYPALGVPSTARAPITAPLDVTTLGANPAVLGSSEFGTSGRLADFSAAANTPSYLVFDIQAGDPSILSNNLAMTNCANTPLVSATKTANRSVVRLGDTVDFTLTFINGTGFAGSGVTLVDKLPAGMVYTPGSARLNGAAIEPQITGTRLRWTGQTLTPGTSITLTLSARVVASGAAGALTNQAWIVSPGAGIVTNTAEATVRIEPEHVFDCADIIGKVFEDKNLNGYQDAGEPGIPGARVVTLRGVRITTDAHGRFHVPCGELPAETGANFALKLDTRSLPTGYRVTTENPRSIRVTAGKMARINFGAAIGRVVDVNLGDAAFLPGQTSLTPQAEAALDHVLSLLREEPSILRLSYLRAGEPRDVVNSRMDAVERRVKAAWAQSGRYKLNIERTIKEVQ